MSQNTLIVPRRKQKQVDAFYRKNCKSFIEDLCWLFDPDSANPIKRFKLFTYQNNLVEVLEIAIKKGEDVLVEKCRQTGCSWVVCAFILWALLYMRGFTALIISYKQNVVDDGGENSTVKSLLGRIGYMIKYLPKVYRDRIEISFCKIRNVKNGNFIIGEASSKEASRGQTYKLGFWDEVSSSPFPEQIYAAFSQSCKSKLFVSTPRGKQNYFATIRFETPIQHVIKIEWKDDPRKNEKWFLWQKQKLSPEQFASEILVDYVNSQSGKLFKLKDEIHKKKIEWSTDDGIEKIISWDFGVSDYTVGTIMLLDWNGDIGVVDELYGREKEIRFYVDLICGVPPREFELMSETERKPYEEFLKRSIEREYRHVWNVAGHEANSRSILGKVSIREQFKTAERFKWDSDGNYINKRYINLKFISYYSEVQNRILTIKALIDPSHNKIYFGDVPKLYEHLSVSFWKGDKPDHDDFLDAFSYGIYYLKRKSKMREGVPDTCKYPGLRRMFQNAEKHRTLTRL